METVDTGQTMCDGYERYVEPYSYEVRDRRVRIARGLQEVDGLTTSDAFEEPAKRYVEGEIGASELQKLVDAYYESKLSRAKSRYSEEADLVSARICAVLESNGFFMAPVTLQDIHERLFHGLMEESFYERNFRDYNFSKREFILARDSVQYGDCARLQEDLNTVFADFSLPAYHIDDPAPYAAGIAHFIARIWQIHPFAEGNTRTTAVFLQKLLRNRGFKDISNELFAENSLRFRNALVRASYSNDALGVTEDPSFLNRFVEGLLRNETTYPFRNRDMCAPELFAAKGMPVPNAEPLLIG